MGRSLASLLIALALLAGRPAHAQSRLDKLEAAGASSALDRFEFGRSKVRKPPPPPPPSVRVLPLIREDPPVERILERARRRNTRPERAVPKTVEVRAPEKPKPEPTPEPPPKPKDPWLSHAGTVGWGPMVIE